MTPSEVDRLVRKALRDTLDDHVPARALSVPSAARALGLSDRTVAQLIADGRLRSVKVGGRRLVPAAALDELMYDLEHEAQENAS